jgi:hypothetical protein
MRAGSSSSLLSARAGLPKLQARFFLVRRCPSGIPSARAFCLRAPGVRLSALEMVFTRVLSFECCFNSLTSARVQSRRTTRFLLAMVLAISFSSFYSQALIAHFFGLRRVLQSGCKTVSTQKRPETNQRSTSLNDFLCSSLAYDLLDRLGLPTLCSHPPVSA